MSETRLPAEDAAAETLRLIDEARESLDEAAERRWRGEMPWRAAVALMRAESCLRWAADRCHAAALEVWPLPVSPRGESHEG